MRAIAVIAVCFQRRCRVASLISSEGLKLGFCAGGKGVNYMRWMPGRPLLFASCSRFLSRALQAEFGRPDGVSEYGRVESSQMRSSRVVNGSVGREVVTNMVADVEARRVLIRRFELAGASGALWHAVCSLAGLFTIVSRRSEPARIYGPLHKPNRKTSEINKLIWTGRAGSNTQSLTPEQIPDVDIRGRINPATL